MLVCNSLRRLHSQSAPILDYYYYSLFPLEDI